MTNLSSNLTLVFDLGGVLIDWDPRHLYRKLFEDDQEMEYFLTNICSPTWNQQMDLGKPFSKAVVELAAEHPDYAEEIRAYDSRWEEMVPGAIEESVALLQTMYRRGYSLAALSNWSHEKYLVVEHRFSFLEWFDHIIISGAVKLAKPDPRIFKLFLDRNGKEAADCLFIDDSESNIAVAQQLGFQTIHFQSAATLEDALRRLNLPGI